MTQPTLAIWGMADKALLPVQLDGLGEHVPDLTVERVEGAGHFVPWENPQAVIDAMRRWGIKGGAWEAKKVGSEEARRRGGSRGS